MYVQANIIDCIINAIKNHNRIIGVSKNDHNRLHALGDSLEDHIKDLFASTCDLEQYKKAERYNSVFSYGGGKNNPPDAILRYGDAIEVKKVESIGNIPLNSSYPKSMLYKDDYRLSSFCRNIENGEWYSKDIIYAIGCVEKRVLKSLVLVYGSIYCADKEYYEMIFNTIKDSIKSAPLELEETNELAHINAVDPLGITYFRARSLWGISHPFKVYDYIHHYNNKNNFELMAIIPTVKFNTFENREKLSTLSQKDKCLNIVDTKVKNPNNTAELVDVKLVTYTI